MGVARFFASAVGRWLRALVGLALIVGTLSGWPLWLGIIGVLFVVVAAGNVCLLAPLFGGPVRGRGL